MIGTASISRKRDSAVASGPVLPRALGYEGIQIFGGRMGTQFTTGASGNTFEFVTELMGTVPAQVGSVRAILGTSVAGTTPADISVAVSAKSLGAIADADASFSTTATFVGGLTATATIVYPQTTSRRKYVFTDPITLTPAARTDGGTKALIGARGFISTANANTALLGSASDDFSTWPTRAKGLARFRSHPTTGDQRTNASGWTASNTGVVVGFSFTSSKKIVNVFGVGDSITEGRGQYVNEGFTRLACDNINALSPSASFVYSNMGWSGLNTLNFIYHLYHALEDGIIPDVVVCPIGSPNDTGGNPITDAMVDNWRSRAFRILEMCGKYQIIPVFWTILPVNSMNWDATDAKRVAYNAEMLATFTASGVAIVDLASLVSGATVDGQVQFLDPLQDDGIHPNDACMAILETPIRAKLRAVTGV
jgi:lysophospholipase L1-like esterase